MIDNNNEILVPLGIILAVLLLLILNAFVMNWLPFRENRDYIKMEMHRAEGSEYRYWSRQLKTLYLSHIPIVGWFFQKKY